LGCAGRENSALSPGIGKAWGQSLLLSRMAEGTLPEAIKHFEASTRDQAFAAADEWWRSQQGLAQTLRLVFPDGDGRAQTWKVVIHFENAKGAPGNSRPQQK
jgi:hypothetical protein